MMKRRILLLYCAADRDKKGNFWPEGDDPDTLYQTPTFQTNETEYRHDLTGKIQDVDGAVVLWTTNFIRSIEYQVLSGVIRGKPHKYIVPIRFAGVNAEEVRSVAGHTHFIDANQLSGTQCLLSPAIQNALSDPAYLVTGEPITVLPILPEEPELPPELGSIASVVFQSDSPAKQDQLGRMPLVEVLHFLLHSQWKNFNKNNNYLIYFALLFIINLITIFLGIIYFTLPCYWSYVYCQNWLFFLSTAIGVILLFIGFWFYPGNKIRREMRDDVGLPFRLHLQGEWGVGKTSIWQLLKNKLASEKDKAPITIEYNVWRHQQDPPAWWQLPRELYRQAKADKPWYSWRILYLKYYMLIWRFQLAWQQIYLTLPILLSAIFIVCVVIFLLVAYYQSSNLSFGFVSTDGDVKYIAVIIAALLALFGVLLPIARRGWAGENDAVQKSLSAGDGPMTLVREHFYTLAWLINRPILIFIDDLDRCEPEQVAEVLRAIHNLFDVADRVSYIIAADRDWLQCCYERVYKDLIECDNTEWLKETKNGAKPSQKSLIGYRFMEKLFDLSIKIPDLDSEPVNRYIYSILDNQHDEQSTTTTGDEQRENEINALARKAIQANSLEGANRHLTELRSLVHPDNFMRVALRVASHNKHAKALHQRTTDNLCDVGTNPRQIKHIVNLVSIRWPLARAYQFNLEIGQIIRWTIFQIRFPLLFILMNNDPETGLHYIRRVAENNPNKETTVIADRGYHAELSDLVKCGDIMSLFDTEDFADNLLPYLRQF